jgi:hypothetical protein
LTAQPAPETRVVTVPLRWPGYWEPLIGVRMPAFVEAGKVMAGVLVAVDEGAETVRLTFSDLAIED